MKILVGIKEGILAKDWRQVVECYNKITGESLEVPEEEVDRRQSLIDYLTSAGVEVDFDNFDDNELEELYELQSISNEAPPPASTVSKDKPAIFYKEGANKIAGDVTEIRIPKNDPAMKIKANEDNFVAPDKRPPPRRVTVNCITCKKSFQCKPELVSNNGDGQYGVCESCSG